MTRRWIAPAVLNSFSAPRVVARVAVPGGVAKQGGPPSDAVRTTCVHGFHVCRACAPKSGTRYALAAPPAASVPISGGVAGTWTQTPRDDCGSFCISCDRMATWWLQRADGSCFPHRYCDEHAVAHGAPVAKSAPVPAGGWTRERPKGALQFCWGVCGGTESRGGAEVPATWWLGTDDAHCDACHAREFGTRQAVKWVPCRNSGYTHSSRDASGLVAVGGYGRRWYAIRLFDRMSGKTYDESKISDEHSTEAEARASAESWLAAQGQPVAATGDAP